MSQKPWDRQKGETLKAFEAFQVYLELGHERGVGPTAAKFKVKDSAISGWMSQWKWKSRVEAWDAFVAESHRKALVKTLNQSSEVWAQRRVTVCEQEWELAEKIRQRALEMLALPLHEQVIDEVDEVTGRAVRITVKPMKWTMRDAFAAGELFSQLSRRSGGMTNNREEIAVTVGASDEKIEKARVALDKLREEMAATLQNEELIEMLRQLPDMVAKNFGVKITDLITDGDPPPPVPEPITVDGTIIQEDKQMSLPME